MRRAIEGGHGDAESKLDGVVVVPGLLVNVDRISFGLTKEIALGQRWSFVRELGLVADEDDGTVIAEVAQSLGCFARPAGADDDDGLGIWHSAIIRRKRPTRLRPSSSASFEPQ